MMPISSQRKIIGIVIALVLVVIGIIVFFLSDKPIDNAPEVKPTFEEVVPLTSNQNIGKSVEGRKIEAYTFGKGEKHLLIVGGIHGGYEWNSVVLSYELLKYFKDNPEAIPENMKLTIVPSANPDGVYKVIGKEGEFGIKDVPTKRVAAGLGRFNANDVDLNRNFACNWKSTSTWQSKTVSAGTKAFSEPEAQALRDLVIKEKPVGVVFLHSQSNAVYASECNKGILPQTIDIMNAYSKASKYPAVKTFTSYAITGDAEGWLASINIPAITVELKTHETIEFDRNLAGVKALLEYYRK